MNGIRVETSPHLLKPGEYCLWNGVWYGQTPNDMLANLAKHTVTENADGTISVSPSILVTGGGQWHGHLEHGIWKEC